MLMTLKTRQDISHTKMETTIKKKLLPFSFIALVTISLTVPYQTAVSASHADLFPHGIGSNANPRTLFLHDNSATSTTAKFRDSAGVNIAGGNTWKEIGDWTSAGVAYFDNAADGGGVDDNRVFKQPLSIMPSIWTGDFDYKSTTSTIPAAYACALTPSTANPGKQAA